MFLGCKFTIKQKNNKYTRFFGNNKRAVQETDKICTKNKKVNNETIKSLGKCISKKQIIWLKNRKATGCH